MNGYAVLAAVLIPIVCGLIASYLITHFQGFSARHKNIADTQTHDDSDL